MSYYLIGDGRHRPCPFCGSLELEAHLILGDAGRPADDPYQVHCIDCESRGPTAHGSEEAAWEQWDRPSRVAQWDRQRRLEDGSTCEAVIQDGALRLVIWSLDEDPLTDEPWVVASVSPDGSVETFGFIPGRECVHRYAPGVSLKVPPVVWIVRAAGENYAVKATEAEADDAFAEVLSTTGIDIDEKDTDIERWAIGDTARDDWLGGEDQER